MSKEIDAAAVILIVLAASACGAGDRPRAAEWAGTVDTLSNGAIHVQNPRAGVWEPAAAWRLTPELRIGALEGGGPDVFGQVRDIAADAYGRIYVLDHQAGDVRVFDVDGTHLRTLGRPGSGPGEFEYPNGLEWGPDGHLWISDPGNARYTVYDTTGAHVGGHRRDIPVRRFLWPGAFDDAGFLYDRSMRMAGEEREDVLLRMDSTATAVDTFPLPSYDAPLYRVVNGRAAMAASVPFAPRLHQGLDRTGAVWFGVSDDYQIHRRALRGDTLLVVERDYEPVPVTAEEKADELGREFLQRMREQGAEIDPDRVPEHKPTFQAFTVDPAGYLWVVPTTRNERSTAFDIFDPDGRYLGRVDAGVDLSLSPPPVVHRRTIYAVAEDEFDVPYVVRLGIDGRPAPTGSVAE